MRSILAYVLAMLGTGTAFEKPVGVPGLIFTEEYVDEVANHSASIHPNFSKNTVAGAQANGRLVTADVELYFSGSTNLGSAAGEQALAFDPTGGLRAQFLDRLIIQIVRNPIANTSSGFTFKIKERAAQFNIQFNNKSASANGLLATENVTVVSDGRNSTGRASLVNLFTRYNTLVPDLLLHHECVIAQGNWAATEYIFQGTRNGTFTMVIGTEVAPNGAQYRARGMRFMRFNKDGSIDLSWQAADNDIFVNPPSLLNPLAVLTSVAPECIAQIPA
ncbi:hypothetical protein V8C34DRAFT_303163 [Trichoderma compactum]